MQPIFLQETILVVSMNTSREQCLVEHGYHQGVMIGVQHGCELNSGVGQTSKPKDSPTTKKNKKKKKKKKKNDTCA
jgi:hypothetical protein